MSLAEYLRPFTNAFEQMEQLAHLHAIGHTILNKLNTMEENMVTQSDIDNLSAKIDTAVGDLASEISAIKDAHPDIDLSGLESSVQKLSDLDVANSTAPTSEAPATPASTEAPSPDASGEVIAPATDDSTAVEVPTEAPAPADAATATDDSAAADASAPAADASAPVSGANATPGI